jgi:transitional endoplasmic reticulum ATPase
VGIEADDSRLYVLLQTGVYVDLYADSEGLGIEVGDILMVASDLSEVRPAPANLWPSKSWIAVVRHVAEDLVVVTGPGGGWRRIPVSAVRCKPGNTVECDEIAGVLRLISDDPLPDLEIAEKGRRKPSEFKVNLGLQTESFDDFAGQPEIVARARELIELPLAKRELLDAIGAPPVSGVLLTGPPGTGKTMLSRIIARASGATLYLIRGPEIGGRYYGESEDLLRDVHAAALADAPSIILLDEVDSVAPARGDDTHEVSQRIVGQLLSILDGFTPAEGILFVATTNRKDAVDPALLRPGRLDWELAFSLPDRDGRQRILEATRPRGTAGELPLGLIADRTAGWSPAELKAIWTEASLLAVGEDRGLIVDEDLVGGLQRRIKLRSTPRARNNEEDT